MKFTIRKRIYLSFSLLVSLFVINAIFTVVTINYNKKLSKHISEVLDPSLQALENFSTMMIESKMYSTNWVFLRANQEDKNALIKLHTVDFKNLKSQLNRFSMDWQNKNWIDSLNNVIAGFEELLLCEKHIMNSLMKFEDYDDAVRKFGAEAQLENTILPKT